MSKLKELLNDLGSYLEKRAVSKELKETNPKELHIELTYDCNTSCIMCNLRYWKRGDKKDISLEQIKETVIKSEILKDIKFIVLSGGEPLLRGDLGKIVKFFRDSYPETEILILSNFADSKLLVKSLEKIKNVVGSLKKISLGSSIDGIEDKHDLIRGKKANEALTMLHFHPKHAAYEAEMVLRSALANLNQKADEEGIRIRDNEIFIKKATVDCAAFFKRLQTAPKGQGYRIRKRSNHLTIVVGTNSNSKES
jgi:large subunit ribosomal protein L22